MRGRNSTENEMNISILGSTGSIGRQTLEVVRDLKGIFDIEVAAVSGNRNIALLEEQIREFKPKIAAVSDEKRAAELNRAVADTQTRVVCGEAGLCEVAAEPSASMVLAAIVGFAGLVPTLCAIDTGKDIALANKETLVTAGDIVTERVKKAGVRLLPVDSEHSAIFQCLDGEDKKSVRKILLTASGGPFFGRSREELKDVSAAQALKHPNWSMGAKITVDSATMMNKGLEVIEAKHLFGTDIDDIEILVHRESIIHSAVEFHDGSVKAQLAPPSMKMPIAHALTYPQRLPSKDARLSLTDIGRLSFAKPDYETFGCLALALEAGRAGGIMPTVLNAANEAAVAAFLDGKTGFLEIEDTVRRALDKYDNISNPSIDDILNADAEVRASATR